MSTGVAPDGSPVDISLALPAGETPATIDSVQAARVSPAHAVSPGIAAMLISSVHISASGRHFPPALILGQLNHRFERQPPTLQIGLERHSDMVTNLSQRAWVGAME